MPAATTSAVATSHGHNRRRGRAPGVSVRSIVSCERSGLFKLGSRTGRPRGTLREKRARRVPRNYTRAMLDARATKRLARGGRAEPDRRGSERDDALEQRVVIVSARAGERVAVGGEHRLDRCPVVRAQDAARERHDAALFLLHVLAVAADEALHGVRERGELRVTPFLESHERLLELPHRALARFVLATELVEHRVRLAGARAQPAEERALLLRVM